LRADRKRIAAAKAAMLFPREQRRDIVLIGRSAGGST